MRVVRVPIVKKTTKRYYRDVYILVKTHYFKKSYQVGADIRMHITA